MKWAAVFAVCCLSHLSLAQAHIHSQKVRHSDNQPLTLNTWLCALVSSALVGVCGVFPLLVNRWVRLDSSCKDSLAYRGLLSFAVGGLLGDVFLHLLPEAFGSNSGSGAGGHWLSVGIGLWVMVGLFSFLVVERVMKMTNDCALCEMGEGSEESHVRCADAKTLERCVCENSPAFSGNSNSNCNGSNGLMMRAGTCCTTEQIFEGSLALCGHGQISCSGSSASSSCCSCSAPSATTTSSSTNSNSSPQKAISGYLNLVANSTDNFTHGLAIAASYVASPAVGVLTTLAILCHEIPHEIGDFAILLRSGFSLKEAAKAQMLTASGGLVGVVVGLTAEHMSDDASSWLLPFTAGGFLYIALISIVPELQECACFRNAAVEMAFLGLGVMIMALVTIVEKESCSYMPPHLVTT